MDKEEILKIAKERYPIGTIFDNRNIRNSVNVSQNIIKSQNFYFDVAGLAIRESGLVNAGCPYTIYCYKKGWAKIISTPIKNYELW